MPTKRLMTLWLMLIVVMFCIILLIQYLPEPCGNLSGWSKNRTNISCPNDDDFTRKLPCKKLTVKSCIPCNKTEPPKPEIPPQKEIRNERTREFRSFGFKNEAEHMAALRHAFEEDRRCQKLYDYENLAEFRKNRAYCAKPRKDKENEDALFFCVGHPGYKQTGHPLCFAYNVIIDVSKLSDTGFPNSALYGQCESRKIIAAHPRETTPTFTRQFTCHPTLSSTPEKKCEIHIPGRAIFISRDDYYHPFFAIGDVFNLFHELLIAGSDVPSMTNNTLIFFNSIYHHNNLNGPFWDLWKPFYANGGSLHKIADFRELYKGKRVCFDEVLTHMHAGAFYEFDESISQKDISCPPSKMLRDFSSFVLDRMDCVDAYQKLEERHKPIRVLFGVRRIDKTKLKVNGSGEVKYGANPVMPRQISNYEELAESMSGIDSVQNGKFSIELTFVDFAGISLCEQISLARNADVYVAMHGAGLTHEIWMNRRAVVVELGGLRVGIQSFKTLNALWDLNYLMWKRKESTMRVQVQGFKRVMEAALRIVVANAKGDGYSFHTSGNNEKKIKIIKRGIDKFSLEGIECVAESNCDEGKTGGTHSRERKK